jgi:LysM repeat protein
MQCKRCGARLQQGMLICPECGARQGRSPESVRCASCHGRVPIGLTVCPHCGRTVRPAGPRWGLWALLALAVGVVVLWGLGRLPVERVRREIADTRDRLSGLVQVLDLPTPLSPTPTAMRAASLLRTSTPMVFPTIAATQTLTMTFSELGGSAQPVASAITATLTMTPTAVIAPAVSVTLTPLRTPPATPPAPTTTAAPTAAVSPTRAATPALTAKGSPSPISTVSKAAGVSYVVKSGDTLAGIGAQFGISWQDIAAANNISSATGLQVGQVLRIPAAGGLPLPTATPRPQATPTPLPATPTTLPALAAPVLENPADGSRADGEMAEIELRWQPVPGMPAGALYQVTVEYAEGGANRSEPLPPTASTGQRFPPWLFGHADLPGRRYTWYVTVVQMGTDGKGGEVAVPLSPPSTPRWFEWQ